MNGRCSDDAEEELDDDDDDDDDDMKSDDAVRIVSVKDLSPSVGSILSFTILTGAGRPSISQCKDGAGRPKKQKSTIIRKIPKQRWTNVTIQELI